MKMENAVTAPFYGQIKEIAVKLHDVVKEGQLLFIISSEIDEPQREELE